MPPPVTIKTVVSVASLELDTRRAVVSREAALLLPVFLGLRRYIIIYLRVIVTFPPVVAMTIMI